MVTLFALSILLKSLHSFENSVDTDQLTSDDKVELSQFIRIHNVFIPTINQCTFSKHNYIDHMKIIFLLFYF